MSQSKLSSEERLRLISDLLKNADRYVLSNEFDKAQAQVEEVFKIDPDNIYGKAYVKRIEVFRQKHHQQSGETATATSREEKEPEPPTHPPSKEVDQEALTRERAEGSLPDQLNQPRIRKNESQGKLSPEEERRMAEEIIAKEAATLDPRLKHDEGVHRPEPKRGGEDHSPSKREQNERTYREALRKYWKSGSFSEEQHQELERLRHTLEISDELHGEIERSVKLEAYVNAVKEAWREGLITPTSASTLEELRERYSISIDEHLKIEARIMYELHGLRSKGVVMVIDDDVELAKIIKSILRDEGYAPFSAHSPEHALQILERTTPDLILLDVTFPKPSISGFTTYERIRARPNLRFVPVVFLSGLDEEHIVQVGKKLGADDYITKPCSEQMLVSTVEGKIKRYRELRRILESKE